MTLKNIERKAHALGLETRIYRMTGGYDGLFINYERVDEYGQARRLSVHETAPLEKYLARYKIPWEYRGHYTSILIKGEVKTA